MERAFIEDPVLFGPINSNFIDGKRALEDSDDDVGDANKDKLDHRLTWMESTFEFVHSRARLEPWYETTRMPSNWQMNALVFVVGKSFAFLVLQQTKWMNEVDFDFYETMAIRGIGNRDAVCYKNLGNAFYEQCQKSIEKATKFIKKMNWFIPITVYSMGVNAFPHTAVLYSNRAKCYLNERMYEEALADAMRATLLEPTWAKAHFRMGEALYQMGRYSDAICVNERARDLCKEDKKFNKAKDLERLIEQTKKWVKDEDEEEMMQNGMKSWWYATGKESEKQKTAINIEDKLNFAVDMFQDLLENTRYIQREVARTMYESSPEKRKRISEKFRREECGFEDAHELICIDARAKIAVFLTKQKVAYLTTHDRMASIMEELGEVRWINRQLIYEPKLNPENPTAITEALLEKNYEREERWCLESTIVDRNTRLRELTSRIRNAEWEENKSRRQCQLVMSLLRNMEQHLSEIAIPEHLYCKKQLNMNLTAARKTAMVPLVAKLNEAYAEITEKEKEIDTMKRNLELSEALRDGCHPRICSAISAIEVVRDITNHCGRCCVLRAEIEKYSESESYVMMMTSILSREIAKVKEQGSNFSDMEEQIESLTKELKQSREEKSDLEEEQEKSKEELDKSREELKMAKEDLEKSELAAMKSKATAKECILVMERVEEEKELLEQSYKKFEDKMKDEGDLKRSAELENMKELTAENEKLMREMADLGSMKKVTAKNEKLKRELAELEIMKEVKAENEKLKRELAESKAEKAEMVEEVEKVKQESLTLGAAIMEGRSRNHKNVEQLTNFCRDLDKSSQQAMALYEADISGFAQFLEEILRGEKDKNHRSKAFQILSAQRNLGLEKIKTLQQLKADSASSVLELESSKGSKDVTAVMKSSGKPHIGSFDFDAVFQSLLNHAQQRESSMEMTSSQETFVDTHMRSELHEGSHLSLQAYTPAASDSGVSISSSTSPTADENLTRPTLPITDILAKIQYLYPEVPEMIILMIFRQVRRDLGALTESGAELRSGLEITTVSRAGSEITTVSRPGSAAATASRPGSASATASESASATSLISGSLSGLQVNEIIDAVTLEIDYLVQILSPEELKWVAAGAGAKKSGGTGKGEKEGRGDGGGAGGGAGSGVERKGRGVAYGKGKGKNKKATNKRSDR